MAWNFQAILFFVKTEVNVKVSEARSLIKDGIQETKVSVWADLGCGDGVFTYALAKLLSPGSKIYAVDK